MLQKIPEEIIENVRASNDIVDVIGEYVQLKKQGRRYLGLCPFHSEKTPSFSITPEKQIYYCFGCKKGGNVFTFLMELENYSFVESIGILAERGGVNLPVVQTSQESPSSKEQNDILLAHNWLTKFYHHLLKYTKDGKEAYDYFVGRGIDVETIDAFQLGFSPNTDGFTADFLLKKGFHQQFLVKAGLVQLQDDQRIVDRFRDRVIFPIRNHQGKTVAFGGRTITDQHPKYINSSESELFQKGRLLFNFDLAKRHMRKESEAILFEGQMDVIAAYQAGIKNVVATLGTSLTDSQAKLLNRYVDTVIICYDDDQAGQNASFTAANLLRKIGCEVKISHLQNGMDPDGFIEKFGGESFKNDVIQTSDTYMGFYMRYLKKNYNLSVEGDRISYIQQILKQLAMVDSSVEREYYLKRLSDEYQLSLETLNEEIKKRRKNLSFPEDNGPKSRYTKSGPILKGRNKLLPAFQNAERLLLAHMLQDIELTNQAQNQIGINFTIDEHKIIATHLYAFYQAVEGPNISGFIDYLEDESLRKIVIEIAMIPLLEDVTSQEINDYFKLIQNRSENLVALNEFREQQKIAEQQNDPIKAATIAVQIIALERKLKK